MEIWWLAKDPTVRWVMGRRFEAWQLSCLFLAKKLVIYQISLTGPLEEREARTDFKSDHWWIAASFRILGCRSLCSRNKNNYRFRNTVLNQLKYEVRVSTGGGVTDFLHISTSALTEAHDLWVLLGQNRQQNRGTRSVYSVLALLLIQESFWS